MQDKYKKFINDDRVRNYFFTIIHDRLKLLWENHPENTLDTTFKDYVGGLYDILWDQWDYFGGFEPSEKELVDFFTTQTHIKEMYNWGFKIEDAILEYLDILREIKDSQINETKITIKKILREQISEKLIELVYKDLIKEFKKSGVPMRFKNPSSYSYNDIKLWVNNYGIKNITDKFGLDYKRDHDTLIDIIDTFYSSILKLPKKGSRIRLIKIADKWSDLKEGDLGTVLGYNATPWGNQIMMVWDNGSKLDIIPDEDEYEVLE